MASPITVIPIDFETPISAPPQKNRRKSTPKKFELVVQEQLPLSIVASDPPNKSLNLQKKNTRAKVVKKADDPPSSAMIKAVNFRKSIGSEFPSCIKEMVKSQVHSGFWLGLPVPFCTGHLPKQDAIFVLEVEGDLHEVKYITNKYGLSAGWKRFANKHKLVGGDVLIFHLVETTKFKIYIFRAEVIKVNATTSLLNSEAHTEEMTSTPLTPTMVTKKNKRPDSFSSTDIKKKPRTSALSSTSAPHRRISYQLIEHPGNDSEEVGSEVLEDSSLSKTNTSFENIKTFEDFHIMVNGKCIDRELPDDVRIAYYKLCFYQKQFLHEGVSEGTFCKLVSGLIGETVRIANEIKNCKLTTAKEEFEAWSKSLKSIEPLGMKVDFLCDKLHKLATIKCESEGAMDINKYMIALNKYKRAEEEIKKVAERLKDLKITAKKYECVSGSLKHKADKFENKFKEVVDAPW